LGRIIAGVDNQVGPGIRHFLGLAVISSFLAVFFAHGLTVLLPIAILFLYQLVVTRKYFKSFFLRKLFTESIPLIVFSFVLCLCFFPLILQLQNNKILTGDYLFYGKLAEYMISVGVETKDLNYFSAPAGTQVYHYMDLWLIGGTTKLLNIAATQSVVFVYYMLFLALLFAVIKDFIQLFSTGMKVYFISIFFGMCMVFLSGFTYFVTLLLGNSEYVGYNGFFFPKLLIVYVLICALVFAVWKRESRLVISLLIVGSLAYATLMPSLIAVAIVYFWLEYKWVLFKWPNFKLLLIFGITLTFFAAFYYLNPSGVEPNELYPVKLDFTNLTTRINIAGKTVLFMLLGIVPLVIIYFFVSKNDNSSNFKRVLAILYFACLGGLVCWALLFNITDSVQLWSNFYFPLIGVVYIVFAIVFLMNFRIIILLPFILLDTVIPLERFKFLSETKTSPSQVRFLENKRVGFLNYYNPNLNVYSKNDVVYFGDLSTVMNYANCRIISLSSPEIEVLDGQYENVVKSSNLYNVSKFSLSDTNNVSEYQKHMIAYLDLDYIFVNKQRKNKFQLGDNWKQIESPEAAYWLFKRNSFE
jgi:hypothetical protein